MGRMLISAPINKKKKKKSLLTGQHEAPCTRYRRHPAEHVDQLSVSCVCVVRWNNTRQVSICVYHLLNVDFERFTTPLK